MKKEVLITGAGGRIGSIIYESLKDVFSFTLLDWTIGGKANVKFVDITYDMPYLYREFEDKHAVIHLAWDRAENFKSDISVPNNKLMAENVYKVAKAVGVKRMIMASFVHADDFDSWQRPGLMSVDKIPVPDSIYGVTKVYIESLGRYYAIKHGLEVICIRFGGIDPEDKIRDEKNYKKVFLSRRDCVNLVRCCLEVEVIPGKFCLLYGISNNTDRIHDWSNPLGWVPQDDGLRM